MVKLSDVNPANFDAENTWWTDDEHNAIDLAYDLMTPAERQFSRQLKAERMLVILAVLFPGTFQRNHSGVVNKLQGVEARHAQAVQQANQEAAELAEARVARDEARTEATAARQEAAEAIAARDEAKNALKALQAQLLKAVDACEGLQEAESEMAKSIANAMRLLKIAA